MPATSTWTLSPRTIPAPTYARQVSGISRSNSASVTIATSGYTNTSVLVTISNQGTNVVQPLAVPNMADVLENLLVGSSKENGDLPPKEEFDHYRAVVRELYKRINEMEACYT